MWTLMVGRWLGWLGQLTFGWVSWGGLASVDHPNRPPNGRGIGGVNTAPLFFEGAESIFGLCLAQILGFRVVKGGQS